MIENPIVFKEAHIAVRTLGLIFRVLILGFLGFELIVVQTIDANASELFKINLPDTKTIGGVKQKFDADTDAFYENLP